MSNKIVEVVIPVYRSDKNYSAQASSSNASDVETSAPPTSEPPSESDDSEDTKLRLRNRSGRVKMIESDDEDEVQEVIPQERRKSGSAANSSKPKFKKSMKRKAESSDYEDSTAETDEEDVESEEFTEASDSDTMKKASKKPSKSNRPVKKFKTSTTAKDDQTNKKATGKKPRVPAKDKPVKPVKLREETDPWKLKSKAKQDWKQTHSPPLEMFHFARLVIDEYTYLDGRILAMVQKLTATRRWVLSGTPPIHDFASLKTIATFLDIHLGVDDDGEGSSAQLKKRQRDQTGMMVLSNISIHRG